MAHIQELQFKKRGEGGGEREGEEKGDAHTRSHTHTRTPHAHAHIPHRTHTPARRQRYTHTALPAAPAAQRAFAALNSLLV